jgi:hypothetical protein
MLIARRSRQRGRLPLVDAHLHLLEPHVYLADWHAGLFGTRARLRWRRVRSPRSGSRMACRRTWLRARLYHLFMPSPHLPEAHVCVADRHARLFLARSRLRRRCARPPSSNTAMAWRRKSFRARLNTFSRPLPGLSQRVSRISRWWSGRDRRMVVLESPSTRIWKARDRGTSPVAQSLLELGPASVLAERLVSIPCRLERPTNVRIPSFNRLRAPLRGLVTLTGARC